ncbi:hypothetical protein EJ08DRAFT_678789 [Tothia fuscella]|uniref:Uncharacterized protein n=1 Tax=Tothia fuscella TaxID=1048955 RepID=A0A9P4NSN2_9PEZI|nr:hypothetical protein EJ08DRAFT_678789 [Tothia fuscella]
MAPVEPETLNSNAIPLFFLAVHSGGIALLLGIITRFIYRARNTPPAIRTRENNPRHRRGIAVFSLLTLLSLGLTTYHAYSWRYASYQNWAQERIVNVPGKLWDGWYANHAVPNETLGQKFGLNGWQLGRWMNDVDLQSEMDAVSVGTPRGLWWTYQNFAGLVVWSVFVGLEGRHRNIPQHITVAFVALAQLASLSTAQNLFYILLLLTPIPLAGGATVTGTPHPVVLSLPALISFVGLAFLSTLQKTSIWTTISALGYFVVPHLLTCLAQPNSLHKDKRHDSVHKARKSYEDIFRVLTFASFGLHMVKSFQAIVDEAPPHRYLSHNYVWNMHRTEGTATRYQQAQTVFSRVIGALNDNPVISQVGWDVVLSVLSLCIWAVWHGVDVHAMLRCSGLSWSLPKVPTIKAPTIKRRASKADITEAGDTIKEIAEHISVATPARRGRGRPKKTSSTITRDPLPTTASAAASLGRSTRRSELSFDDTSEDEDYVPNQDIQDEVDEFDFDSEEGLAKESEAAALAWGLFSLGGLGAITSAVLGAESTGR